MIPIKFKSENSIDRLYGLLIGESKRKRRKKDYRRNLVGISKWCENNIIIGGMAYPFEKIIKASYEEIVLIAEAYDKLIVKLPSTLEKILIDYLYSQRFPRKEFVEELQVTVCPYCNRNFVNSTCKRTMCELDHFYNKKTYPILAVSFHNLVPVCHACNHAKGSQPIEYSPHNRLKKTDDLLFFDYFIKGSNFLNDSFQLGIEIDSSKMFESNVKILKLRDVYQVHTDIVQECIKRVIVFNPSYLRNIYNMYPELFESTEELYRMVFGYYLKDTEYGRRPLSKLTKDILSQLLLDIYGIDIDSWDV